VDSSTPLSVFAAACEDNGWSESTITWDTKPTTCSDPIGKVSADGTVVLDASQAVKSIVDGTLTIKLFNPPTVSQIMSMYSKNSGDSTQVPMLYVTQGGGGAEEVATTGSTASSVAVSFFLVATTLIALLF
jgi:hypothetical protein